MRDWRLVALGFLGTMCFHAAAFGILAREGFGEMELALLEIPEALEVELVEGEFVVGDEGESAGEIAGAGESEEVEEVVYALGEGIKEDEVGEAVGGESAPTLDSLLESLEELEEEDAPLAPERPEKEELEFDEDRVSALLDRTPGREAPEEVDDGGVGDLGERLVVSDKEALRSQLKGCWRVAVGAAWAERLKVSVLVRLTRDGDLLGEPRVKARGGGAFGRVAEASALRAIRRCAPFRLPLERYESWKELELVFDPREMAGVKR